MNEPPNPRRHKWLEGNVLTELEKIKRLEYYFPKLFADMEERDYGVMFYNTANPDSLDSNHAVIFRDCDYEKTLQEIKEFYISKNLEL